MTTAEPLFDAGAAPDLLAAGLRMAGMLALLVAGAVAWIVWQRRARRAGRRSLAVVDRLGLGRSTSVVLLSVEGRRMLVGLSPEGIRMLRVLPETAAATEATEATEATDTIAATGAAAEPEADAPPSFAAALGRALARRIPQGRALPGAGR